MAESRRARFGPGLLTALAVLTGLATVVSFLGALDWRADLLAAFRLHFAAAFAILTLLFALGGRTQATLLAALGLGVNAAPTVDLFWPDSAEVDRARPALRLLTYNAANGVGREAEIAEWIADSPVDLAVVTEVTPELLAALEARWPETGTVVAEARRDNFGIAVLARGGWLRDGAAAPHAAAPAVEAPPLEAARVVRLRPGVAFPSVVAELDWAGERVAVLGLHPPPPVSAQHSAERDRQLEAAAAWARGRDGPVILAGDLNATRFSPVFDRLVEAAGLVDSADGFGWQPTWPASFGPVGIPIDHVLHDPAMFATERFRGPSFGSDHRPLLVTLRWRLAERL